MKLKNFIFYRKGFSLVEVVVTIAVLTLCIMALLSTYYSIYKLQNKAMYDSLLQRKAETIFFTKIYPNIELLYTKEKLDDLLKNDEDVNKYIEILTITVSDNNSFIKEINLSRKEADESTSRKNKKGYTITIEYEILKTKTKKTTEIYIPVIVNLPPLPPSTSDNTPPPNYVAKDF